MNGVKNFNNYFVQRVTLSGTTAIKVQLPAVPSRIDITSGSDAIEFAIVLKNSQRVQYIKMNANSFYSIDIQADQVYIRGQAAAAASEVQIVGFYEVK